MNLSALSLRALSREALYVFNTLGRGISFKFSVEGERGQLILDNVCVPMATPPATVLSSACGPFAIYDDGALLSRLGHCPIRLPIASDDWVWALYNAGLSPELHALIGPLGTHDAIDVNTPRCRLRAQIGAQQHECSIQLPAATLKAMLARAHWQSVPPSPATRLQLYIPIVLGRLQLSLSQLRPLSQGDVLIPTPSHFTADGQGVCLIGPTPWPVRITYTGQQSWLQLMTEGEPCMSLDFSTNSAPQTEALSDTEDDFTHERHAEPDTEEAAERPHGFTDLILPLTIRCGHLQLSLDELLHLAPGSVLTILDTAPGEAALYHGERRLAQGDLVQIDHCLGLQITRLDSLA